MFIILNLFFESQRAEQDRNIIETNISVKHIDILQKKNIGYTRLAENGVES